jgi:predicted deacylase
MKSKNKNPKQNKVQYSFVNVLTGSDLSERRLAIMKAQGKKPGPVVWLTGAIHGDEVGGMVIIQEIFKELRKTPLLQGSLLGMPLMNPIGFETSTRGLPLSEEDLNRSFPGDKNGTIAERIAQKIFSTIIKTNPSLVLDLHNDWSASIPYVLVDPYPGAAHKETYEKVKKYSLCSGFPVINEQETAFDSVELQKTLSGSLLKMDIPAFTFEVGGAYVVNEVHVQSGVRAIWNILAELGMVESRQLPNQTESAKTFYKNKIIKYSHEPRADASGIVRFIIKPGQIVKRGQPVARIYNVFGKLQSTLLAQKDGLVLGHADSAVAFPGAEIVAFGV